MKKVLISMLVISFIMQIFTTVYASTGVINLGTSSDTVEKGQSFNVTIAGIADNNIIAMQTNLEYDSSRIIIEDRIVGEGFIDASGENEIAIMASSNDTLSKTGTLYTITFKVLDTAVDGETEINFKGATLGLINDNSEDEVVNVGEQSVSITIKKKEDTTGGGAQGGTGENSQTPGNTQTPEDNEDGDKNSKPSNDGNNSNTDNSGNNDSKGGNENKHINTNKNLSSNKNTTKLPQTGAESLSIVALIVLGVSLIISYVSYRKYKNI